MAKLYVCSHNLDDEFEALIFKDYQVKVIDKVNAPWSVVFEGTKENLTKMFNEYWDAGENGGDISNWLKE